MIRAFLCALLLTGCTCNPKIIEVPVSCVKETPIREPSVFDALPEDADIAEHTRALFIDRDVTEIYVGGLEAIVAGCR